MTESSPLSVGDQAADFSATLVSLGGDTDAVLAISEAYGVTYRALKLFSRPRRPCFLIDQNREIRYRWTAEHAIDATRDKPPVSEVHEAITDELNEPETEMFGFS